MNKIQKELKRFKKRLLYSSKDRRLEGMQFRLDNLPYEIYHKVTKDSFHLTIPIIKTTEETLDKIIEDKCSLSRFGDGEFSVMNGGRINYQSRSSELAGRLKEVLKCNEVNLLIGLPDCFGGLDNYLPDVVDFWRKWMSRKREIVYSSLNMNREYYNAFFSRVYMQFNKTEEHYQYCDRYYKKIKKIWSGRDVVICEGEETRFGMCNDLLEGAKSISRILCPSRSAFSKYEEILSCFNDVTKDRLVLIALGPTATILAYDLCNKGYQAIDIGATDLDYEWFLRKETKLGAPVTFKYVDGSNDGRKVHRLDNSEYKSQIIKRIV